MNNTPQALGNQVILVMDKEFSDKQWLKAGESTLIIVDSPRSEPGLQSRVPHWGKIVSLGDGERVTESLRSAQKDGRHVYVGQFQGQPIMWHGVEYRICEPNLIFAVEPAA